MKKTGKLLSSSKTKFHEKKLLSMLLTVCMVLTLLPTTALATLDDTGDSSAPNTESDTLTQSDALTQTPIAVLGANVSTGARSSYELDTQTLSVESDSAPYH